MATLAEQKVLKRTNCNDIIEIQTDGSVLPAAHYWPMNVVIGDTCQCGAWIYLPAPDGGTMIVRASESTIKWRASITHR